MNVQAAKYYVWTLNYSDNYWVEHLSPFKAVSPSVPAILNVFLDIILNCHRHISKNWIKWNTRFSFCLLDQLDGKHLKMPLHISRTLHMAVFYRVLERMIDQIGQPHRAPSSDICNMNLICKEDELYRLRILHLSFRRFEWWRKSVARPHQVIIYTTR